MEDKIVFIVMFLISIVPLIGLTYFLNDTCNNGIIFGVRIPQRYIKEPEIIELQKQYKKYVMLFSIIPITIISIVYIYIMDVSKQDNWFFSLIIIYVIISYTIPYIIIYKKMKKLKKNKGWNLPSSSVVVVDTSLRNPKRNDNVKLIPSYYYYTLLLYPIVNLGITIKYIGELQLSYSLLENLITSIIMTIVMIYLGTKVTNSKSDLNSGTIKGTVYRKKRFKRVSSMMLLTLGHEMNILYCILQYNTLNKIETTDWVLYFTYGVISITMVIYTIILLKVGQGGKNIKIKEGEETLYKDDDKYWLLGIMYNNPNDPAWFVEKRVGIGWTVNVGTVIGKVITIGTVVVLIIIMIAGFFGIF